MAHGLWWRERVQRLKSGFKAKSKKKYCFGLRLKALIQNKWEHTKKENFSFWKETRTYIEIGIGMALHKESRSNCNPIRCTLTRGHIPWFHRMNINIPRTDPLYGENKEFGVGIPLQFVLGIWVWNIESGNRTQNDTEWRLNIDTYSMNKHTESAVSMMRNEPLIPNQWILDLHSESNW